MIRRLAIVLVPVLLALGAWLLLREGDGEPVPGMSMEPPTPAAAALTALPVAPLAAEAVTTAPTEVTEVRSEAASDNRQPPLPADAKWLDVLVVDAGTQQPVAGAEVRWSDRDAFMNLRARERSTYANDGDLFVKRFGWQARSDAKGVARIAVGANGASVTASSDGRHAGSFVGGRQPEPKNGWRIELEPDLTLRARVLSATGQPVPDVQVLVQRCTADGKFPQRLPPATSRAPDGIAEFRHIQTWRSWGNQQQTPSEVTWRIALHVPGIEDPGVPFDANAPPNEPIVLQLPATGSIAARLQYRGQPPTDDVTFCAYRGKPEDSDRQNLAVWLPAEADGWVRFAHVPLGGSFVVMARCNTTTAFATVDGPAAVGQEVRVELQVDDHYALAGRVLGADGNPLANALVEGQVDAQVVIGFTTLSTDAQGRFVWLLTKGFREQAELRKFTVTLTQRGAPTLQAKAPPRKIARGLNELGDLQLREGLVVVAGRFVLDPPDSKGQVPFQVEVQGPVLHNGQARWQPEQGLTQHQDADGTFEVRGEPGAGRYRLFFPAYDHLPVAPIEFAVGKEDLVIAITKGCALAASCLPPEGLPCHLVRAHLQPNGASAAVPKQQDESPWHRGPDRLVSASRQQSRGRLEWTWRAVPAGLYTFTVRALGNPTPLATIENVVLPEPAGGDPRLRDIDLREHISIRKVHVTRSPQQQGNAAEGADGEGLTATVFTMPQEDQRVWQGTQVRGGVATVVAPTGPIELLVACVGMQPKRLVTTEPEVTVALEPWPTVEITFADLAPLPAGFTLHASLRDRNRPRGAEPSEYRAEDQGGGQSALLQPDDSGAAVEGGRVNLRIGEGRFRLSLYLLRTEGENSRTKFLRNVTPGEIQGGPGLAPIVVQLSADEVRAAIEEMQKTPWKK